MQKMNVFYVAKLLDIQGVYRPDGFILGNVELRPPSSDFEDELETIKISIQKNKITINPNINCRIGTIVHAATLKDAELFADEKFVGALDIISSEFPISRISLSKCGYIKNLESGELTPIEDVNFSPNMAFVRPQSKFQIMEFSQWVTMQNSELAVRYRRSLHWSRNSKWEKNLQIRILFNWFAVEALFKENEEDKVAPLIRWFLGYPNGPSAENVSSELIEKLKSNSLYNNWKNKITNSIEQIRIFRNESVHSGFRNVDFSVSDMKLFSQLMTFGCSRCQCAVSDALRNGLKTVSEFKEYISLIFENKDNLVNDVHSTILYSLENNSYSALNEKIYG